MKEYFLNKASLTTQLVDILRKDIDEPALERAGLHLLDWLACSLAAKDSSLTKKLRLIYGNHPFSPAHHLGDRILLLASLGNQLEMDDVHKTSILHPGPVVCPVAVLAAMQQKATPRALLEALIVGYETTIRIGRSIGQSHYRYFHNTSTCGTFGAASAAAILYGLEPEQWCWALGNAGTRTGGLWQLRHENVDSKSLHNAQAAHTGWMAAELASMAVSGPAYILEGVQGLFAAMSQDATPAYVIQPEPDWLIHQVSFKPWPACRHAHAAIDAFVSLLNEFSVDNLDSIEVQTYGDAVTFCDQVSPETEIQAKFSIQHAISVLLLSGELKLEDFSLEKIEQPEIIRWRQRVKITQSIKHSKRYPGHYGADVVLHFVDGTFIRSSCDDAKGDPENPLTADELMTKAHTLMHLANITQHTRDNLIDCVLSLHKQETCETLWELLRDCFSDAVKETENAG